MGLLERPRPHVHVLEVIVLALEREGAFLGPGAHHEVVRLVEALMAEGGIGREGIVFGADAPDHAADQAAAGDAVDHRVLFGQRQRVLADAEGVAENGDPGARRAPRQGRRRDHRRRHQPVGVLMVFVDAQPVEPELLAEFELVEIGVVEIVPPFGSKFEFG